MTAILRKMIDTDQTAAKTGINPSRQKKLRDRGEFAPWYRIGRKVYYDEDELAEWLASQAMKPYPRQTSQQADTPSEVQKRMARRIGQEMADGCHDTEQPKGLQDESQVGGDDDAT